MDDRLDALTRRLDRLARETRWYRRGGAIALVLVTAALLMGQAAPPGPGEEVRAKRFILVDGAGLSRGAMTVGPDGTALLILADGQRRPRVSLTVAADGSPSLTVYDAGGKRRAMLGVDRDNVPLLILTDKDDRAVATALTVARDGSPTLTFFDGNQKPRLVASVAGGEPSVLLTGNDGKSGARLAVDQEIPRLALADRNGNERVWVAVRSDSPVLQFFGNDRAARSGLTTINQDTGIAVMSEGGGSVPGVVLFDKDKKIIWSAP